MPATRQSGSSKRASTRSAANGTTRGRTSSSDRSSPSGRSSSSGRRGSSKSSAKRPKSTNGSRSGSRSAAAANRASEATSSASRSKATSSNGNHEAVRAVGASIAGATVGVVGGVVLGRTALQRRRKIPPKIDLTGVGAQIGEAGRQFARLAGEVRSVKEKAEQIGRVLS